MSNINKQRNKNLKITCCMFQSILEWLGENDILIIQNSKPSPKLGWVLSKALRQLMNSKLRPTQYWMIILRAKKTNSRGQVNHYKTMNMNCQISSFHLNQQIQRIFLTVYQIFVKPQLAHALQFETDKQDTLTKRFSRTNPFS